MKWTQMKKQSIMSGLFHTYLTSTVASNDLWEDQIVCIQNASIWSGAMQLDLQAF